MFNCLNIAERSCQIDGNRLFWSLFRNWQKLTEIHRPLWTVIWNRTAWRYIKMSPFSPKINSIWDMVWNHMRVSKWQHFYLDRIIPLSLYVIKAAWAGEITSRSIMSRGNGTSGFSPVSIVGMLAFLISFSTNPAEHDTSTKLLMIFTDLFCIIISHRDTSFCVLFSGKFLLKQYGQPSWVPMFYSKPL